MFLKSLIRIKVIQKNALKPQKIKILHIRKINILFQTSPLKKKKLLFDPFIMESKYEINKKTKHGKCVEMLHLVLKDSLYM